MYNHESAAEIAPSPEERRFTLKSSGGSRKLASLFADVACGIEHDWLFKVRSEDSPTPFGNTKGPPVSHPQRALLPFLRVRRILTLGLLILLLCENV